MTLSFNARARHRHSVPALATELFDIYRMTALLDLNAILHVYRHYGKLEVQSIRPLIENYIGLRKFQGKCASGVTVAPYTLTLETDRLDDRFLSYKRFIAENALGRDDYGYAEAVKTAVASDTSPILRDFADWFYKNRFVNDYLLLNPKAERLDAADLFRIYNRETPQGLLHRYLNRINGGAGHDPAKKPELHLVVSN